MPTLVVQMGHCYRRTGATGTTGEQDYATRVATACRNLLHGRGGWVVRAILADDASILYRGDAFFAIHCDGSTNATARGASIGYRNSEGQVLGQAWKRAYEARGWSGFRPDNYTDALRNYYGTGTAVNQGNRRAVILECGFRTNSQDRAMLDAPGGPERVALAIGDALGIPVTPPEEDDMTPQEMLDAKLRFWDGREVAFGVAMAESWQNSYDTLAMVRAFPALLSAATSNPDLTAEEIAQIVRDNQLDAAAVAAQLMVPLQAEIAKIDSVNASDAQQIAEATINRLTANLATPPAGS